ncbi:MAG: hypothetical protein AAF577_07675 [Pseudomonadota bacterium]
MRRPDFEPYNQHLGKRLRPSRFFGGDIAAIGVIFCVLLVI